MQEERMLPFKMARKLNNDELANVVAAGTSVGTANVTYGGHGTTDCDVDVQIDM